MPFGHNPAQFVSKDKYGIGQASQILGSAIAQYPGAKQADETRQKAIDAANADWGDMEAAFKVTRSLYSNPEKTGIGDKLLEQGLITPEELSTNIRSLRAPTSTDQKDAGGYLDKISVALKALGEDAQQRKMGQTALQSQKGLGPERDVGGFTEQDIGKPQGLAGQVSAVQEQHPGATAEQVGQIPSIAQQQGEGDTGQRAALEKQKADQRAALSKQEFGQRKELLEDEFKFNEKLAGIKGRIGRIGSKRVKPSETDLAQSRKDRVSLIGKDAQNKNLVRTLETTIKKAPTGVIDQVMYQQLQEAGYIGPADLPSIEEALLQAQTLGDNLTQYIKEIDEQIKQILKAPQTRFEKTAAAGAKVAGQKTEALQAGNTENAGAGAPNFNITTGALNLDAPAVKEAQAEGWSIEEIIKFLGK